MPQEKQVFAGLFLLIFESASTFVIFPVCSIIAMGLIFLLKRKHFSPLDLAIYGLLFFSSFLSYLMSAITVNWADFGVLIYILLTTRIFWTTLPFWSFCFLIAYFWSKWLIEKKALPKWGIYVIFAINSIIPLTTLIFLLIRVFICLLEVFVIETGVVGAATIYAQILVVPWVLLSILVFFIETIVFLVLSRKEASVMRLILSGIIAAVASVMLFFGFIIEGVLYFFWFFCMAMASLGTTSSEYSGMLNLLGVPVGVVCVLGIVLTIVGNFLVLPVMLLVVYEKQEIKSASLDAQVTPNHAETQIEEL